MTDYALGQRVAYTEHLIRRSQFSDNTFHPDVLKVWTSESYPGHKTAGGEGVIIGKRTLTNGRNHYSGYDEPITFIPKERFSAYLVAFDLRRKPVYVLPEHITALEEPCQ